MIFTQIDVDTGSTQIHNLAKSFYKHLEVYFINVNDAPAPPVINNL